MDLGPRTPSTASPPLEATDGEAKARRLPFKPLPDPFPVTAREYLAALDWQAEHCWDELASEGTEAVARAMRRWASASS